MSLTSLETVLLNWATVNWCEPVEAMLKNPNREYARKCFGSIFRRAAGNDPRWLYEVLQTVPLEFLALAPYIGTVKLQYRSGVLSVPGAMGWPAYLKAMEDLDGMTPYEQTRVNAEAPACETNSRRQPVVTIKKPGLFGEVAA
jgi:hypothetical protein